MVFGIMNFVIGKVDKYFYYQSLAVIDLAINTVLKVIYAEPRPYMVDTSLFLTCSRSFGNPSGHASGSSLLSIGLFLDIFHGCKVNES